MRTAGVDGGDVGAAADARGQIRAGDGNAGVGVLWSRVTTSTTAAAAAAPTAAAANRAGHGFRRFIGTTTRRSSAIPAATRSSSRALGSSHSDGS
jgi:hypothetical protein